MTTQQSRSALSTLPKAVLFDHDGVLVASEALHWVAWQKMGAQMGLQIEIRELQALAGCTAPQILEALLNRHRPGWRRDEYDLDAIALEKNAMYLLDVPTQLRTYPGVPEGLTWLKSKAIKIAVVSNAKRRELDASLKTTKIEPFFDVNLSRDDIAPPKPDPTPYLHAAKLLGVAPSDCLVVEDAPPGLLAGLRAGIPTVGILSSFSRERLESVVSDSTPGHPARRASAIFANMIDLFAHLKGLSP